MGIANKVIDATSAPIVWQHINWKQANKTVRRLQARIVKALQENNQRKVRALQFLLTRSLSGASLAVRRVTENTGKRTPGIDKQIWRTHRQKTKAVQQIRQGQYRAKPLRRIYIPKANSAKKRPLGIPCMDDRAKQALYLIALAPVAEYYADPNSYGFRKGRSARDAIGATCTNLSHRHSAQWILECDIQSCFDQISHPWLLKRIPMNKRILAQWLQAGYVERQRFHQSNAGTPQGGIISPTLANLTLDGLEQQLKLQFKRRKVNIVRYADDFIITGASRSLLEEQVKPLVERFLAARGLTLSKTKTRITPITEGFDFLGFTIRKFGNKLTIKPAKSSIKRLLRQVKQVVRKQQVDVGRMLVQLNPILRGWSLYYRHVASAKTFSYVDHHVWQIIWRWAIRRHKNKGRKWIKKKYFSVSSRSAWEFKGKLDGNKVIHLIKCQRFTIRNHIKVRGAANPYDETDWEYFEKRQGKANRFLHSQHLRKLWNRQTGKCLLCKNPITKRSGWHTHHIKRRCDGGQNKANNLALLHPVCHEQWHQRDYETWAGLSRDSFKRA